MLKNNPKYYDAHWMPYSGNREFKANPRIMVSAKDSYYIDDKGRKIFDGHQIFSCLYRLCNNCL
jgi:beta-alanine--pyruvate transaminase